MAVPFLVRAQSDREITLHRGMVIKHSVVVKKMNYKFSGENNLSRGVIIIDGNDITVDFNGAVLLGAGDKERPDNFSGVGLLIKPGSNITVKNARIRGYKIGLLAERINSISIENCDLSNNFRQHLNSNRFREDLSDWQSYHDNENDQWMRFGAGIYLKGCTDITIKNNEINQGQCGLMMVKCTKGNVFNNNFSFNSGIGIGLYRSSYLKIIHNKVDWNVRGVSDGYYYRGQDAAAILVYEQGSDNVIAFNSATHSGDGIFLWAGYSTLATGKGGSNDNLIFGNDFSFAPANGVEATFSRNRIINNYIEGCDYGVWGGYSHHTLIQGNVMKANNMGVAIEQGQDNQVTGNQISEGRTGIQIWSTSGRVMSEKYDKIVDVSSRNYSVENNSFEDLKTVFSFWNSKNIEVKNNRILHADNWIQCDTSADDITLSNNGNQVIFKIPAYSDTLVDIPERAKKVPRLDVSLKGRKYIMMTPWGPYDFKSPVLWWENTDASGRMNFEIQGPAGKWVLKKSEGAEDISSEGGQVPGVFSFRPEKNKSIDIVLEYTGGEITSPFGKKYQAGTPYEFAYHKLSLNGDWSVDLFSFDSTNDPVKHPSRFSALLKSSKPVFQTHVSELDNNFWNFPGVKVPSEQTATVAERTIDFPKGKYIMGVSASEMVRVFVDGKKVIDAWDASRIKYDADYHHEVTLDLKGKHTIKIVQTNYGGYRMLYGTITPAKDIVIN